ncbi:MAG: two-component sensor histidine kinase [Chitinophagaceae bacterium]|nr:two-component sensor histidine kinase [Chitinophagaceae bacterium]
MLKKRRLTIITILYWVLLVYIVVALIFWFIELNKQNAQMTDYRMSELKLDDPYYNARAGEIIAERDRKTAQFVGEGGLFLALILIGAVFMYRAVRRQFTLQLQQENFMMAITHELKTPIAVAKLNLETLQKHQLDDARRQKLLQMTLQETDRLNALASNILVSAQLEAGRPFSKEELDFSELVKKCVQEFTNRLPDRQWNISIKEDIEVLGDPLLLQILVNNLIENAVKYSPAKSAIGCRLDKEEGKPVLRITDEGPGIGISERKKIFEKFYRIGSERTRAAKGTGLGLYLCKKIAKDHRSTIQAEENTPRGSVFVVRFEKN